MIDFDWTRKTKPFIVDEVVYYPYPNLDIPYDSSDPNYTNKVLIANRNGLRYILDYYNKDYSGLSFDWINTSIARSEIYIDPRKVCGKTLVLVSIDRSILDEIPEKDIDLNQAYVLDTDTVSLRESLDSIYEYLEFNRKAIEASNFSLYIDGFEYDTGIHNNILKSFYGNIVSLANINDIYFSNTDVLDIKIIFNEDIKISGVILDNQLLSIGLNSFSSRRIFSSLYVNSLVINLEDAVETSQNIIETRNSNNWKSFYSDFLFGEVQFLESEVLKNQNTATDRLKDQAISNINTSLLDQLSNQIKNEYDAIINNNTIAVGGEDCGSISQNEIVDFAKTLYKTENDKVLEDAILNNPALKINVSKKTINVTNFVGDRILDEIFTQKIPTSLDEAFSRAFSYISPSVLIQKAISCLLEEGDFDFSKVCIDLYYPVIVNFPELDEFPSLFDFISDLIVRAFFAIIQQTIQLLLEDLFDILEKCFRTDEQEIEGLLDNKTSDSFFGNNINLAETYIAEKIADNIDAYRPAQDVINNIDKNRFRMFLDDLAAALTPSEFCSLARGQASEPVLKIVLCVLETYPDLFKVINSYDKIESLFKALGAFISEDACQLDRLDPNPDSICLTGEQDELRQALLQQKGVSPDLIAQQIQQIKERKQRDIERLKGFFNTNGDFTSLLYEDEGAFLTNITPCVKDNPVLSNLIEQNLNTILDSIELYFSRVFLENNGAISSYTANSDFKKNYQAMLTNQSFQKVGPKAYSSTDPNVNISYLQTPNSFDHKIVLSNLQVNHTPVSKAISNFSLSGYEDIFEQILIDSGLVSPSTAIYESELSKTFSLMYDLLSSSNFFNISDGEILQKFTSLLESKKLVRNCWRGTEDIIDGIVNTYKEQECVTRNANLISDLLLEGLVSIYVRVLLIDYFTKNFALITNFYSSDFNSKFLQNYLIEVSSQEGVDVSSFDIESMIKDFMEIIWEEFSSYVSPEINNSENNVFNYFVSIVNTHNEAPKTYRDKSNFFIFYNNSKSTINLAYVYSKSLLSYSFTILETTKIAQSAIRALGIDGILNDYKVNLKNSKILKNIYNNSLPLVDFLSIITIYNVLLMKNTSLREMQKSIKYSIDELNNRDDLSFINTEQTAEKYQQSINDSKVNRPKQIVNELVD